MFALREIVLFVCTYVIELSEKSYVDLSAKFPDFTQVVILYVVLTFTINHGANFQPLNP